jgi:hypothetical protein
MNKGSKGVVSSERDGDHKFAGRYFKLNRGSQEIEPFCTKKRMQTACNICGLKPQHHPRRRGALQGREVTSQI